MKQRIQRNYSKLLVLSISLLSLCYMSAEANGTYRDSTSSGTDSGAEEYSVSHQINRELALQLTGKEMKWLKNEEELASSSSTPILLLSAEKDFDLLSTLPENEQQLEALVLSRAGNGSLPMLLNQSPYFSDADFHGHHLFLSDLSETTNGLMATLVFSVLTPEDQVLHFSGRNIPVSGLGSELCTMRMMLEEEFNINDPEFPFTIKGSMNTDSASYVAFNCDGFESFQLLCEYRFPINLVTPLESGRTSVRAIFKLTSEKLGDFIGEVTIDPFEVKGLDDVQFFMENAVVDYSTGRNHDSMKDAINPEWESLIREKFQDPTWRGFFMQELSIKLPESLPGTSGERISIAMKDVMADHGSGITGKLVADPQVKASVSGWGISLDSLLLEVVTNSLREFKLSGDINIPIMTHAFNYEAMFTMVNDTISASFALDLAGEYENTIPFLNDSKIELKKGSTAGISYRAGEFEPHANLSGHIKVEIGDPSVSFPELGFEGLKINDQDLDPFGKTAGDDLTGGLDKISIKAFSLGGVDLTKLSEGIGSVMNSGKTSESSTDDTGNGSEDNSTLAGFPITINNINLEKGMDDDGSYYKLNFGIGLNFAAGSSTFGPKGSFAVWGNLDFSKLNSLEPWETVSYRKTTVESIYIDANLGKVAIEGGIRLINNDPTYGSGFKGAIKLKVKLPAAEFSVACVGQFGTIPAADGGTASYRYFFVDAEVGFASGLQLGNTGLAIYGFSGGIFYNMEREAENTSMAEIAAGKDISDMPKEVEEVEMTTDLLTPGVSLSGVVYDPMDGTTSFQVGLTFGLSAPQTLLADVAFGMTMHTNNGWTVDEITFKGAGYFLNPGVAKRKKAALSVDANLTIDLNNKDLVGSFGMKVRIPPSVPPAVTPALITGSYNMDLNNKITNFYLKFGDEKEFYFFAGTPEKPMQVKYQLTEAIPLGNVQAYFMAAANHTVPKMKSLADIFKEEGFTLGNELAGFGGRNLPDGDAGVGFGARLSIGGDYSFLMFKASLKAFAGFDAGLLHYPDHVSCGKDGTFGIENWYVQGQAYAGFRGSLDMYIDLGFYKGDFNIASLEAAAALQAQLPNPTYLMGFLYGRFSILNGLIKGDFNFKFEAGEKCTTLPDYNPLAGIPLIQDVSPSQGSTLEIYQSPAATFFVPMNEVMEFDVPAADGRTKHLKYRCFLDRNSTKVTKQGSNASISVSITYQDSNKTAIFKPISLLEPHTDYVFTVRVGWKEIKDGQEIISGDYEEKSVSFRTGDRPQKIVPESVAYLAPGYRQRYWHKNYARPMLEFDQLGWDYLFPKERTVNIAPPESDESLNTLVNNGWNSVSKITEERIPIDRAEKNILRSPSASNNPWNKRPPSKPVPINPIKEDHYIERKSVVTHYSKTVPLKYVCRIRDLATNETTDVPLDDYPGLKPNTIYVPIIKTLKIGNEEYSYFAGLEIKTTYGKRVRYDGLNDDGINLNKRHIYSLEIIRRPTETYKLPVTTAEVNNNDVATYNDTLEVYTMETTTLKVTGAEQSQGELQKAINDLNAEEVLYIYHFGVSQYDHLADKFAKVSAPTYGKGVPITYIESPEPNKVKLNSGVLSYADRYTLWYPTEHLDHYDRIYMTANIEFAKGGNYSNPVKDYLSLRNLFTMGGSSPFPEWLFQRIIPYDIYNPIVNEKRITGYTSVIFRDDFDGSFARQKSDTPSFWLDYNGKKFNTGITDPKITYEKYQAFVNWLTDYYLDNDFTSNKLVFFISGDYDFLTQTEIDTKRPSTVMGNTMWLYNAESKIIRNTLAIYRHQVRCIDILNQAGMKVTLDYTNQYDTLMKYYEGGTIPFSELLNDAYGSGRLEELSNKKIGLKLMYSTSSPPEYMGVRNPGANMYKLIETKVNTGSY